MYMESVICFNIVDGVDSVQIVVNPLCYPIKQTRTTKNGGYFNSYNYFKLSGASAVCFSCHKIGQEPFQFGEMLNTISNQLKHKPKDKDWNAICESVRQTINTFLKDKLIKIKAV